jgi:hypothetical protein
MRVIVFVFASLLLPLAHATSQHTDPAVCLGMVIHDCGAARACLPRAHRGGRALVDPAHSYSHDAANFSIDAARRLFL